MCVSRLHGMAVRLSLNLAAAGNPGGGYAKFRGFCVRFCKTAPTLVLRSLAKRQINILALNIARREMDFFLNPAA